MPKITERFSSNSFYLKIFSLSCTYTLTATPEHGPIITGGKARYQIGDIVKLNCTVHRSKPAAHLQWFINSELAEPSITRQYETLVTGREGIKMSFLSSQSFNINIIITTHISHFPPPTNYHFPPLKRPWEYYIGTWISCSTKALQEGRYEIKSMNNWRIINEYFNRYKIYLHSFSLFSLSIFILTSFFTFFFLPFPSTRHMNFTFCRAILPRYVSFYTYK